MKTLFDVDVIVWYNNIVSIYYMWGDIVNKKIFTVICGLLILFAPTIGYYLPMFFLQNVITDWVNYMFSISWIVAVIFIYREFKN